MERERFEVTVIKGRVDTTMTKWRKGKKINNYLQNTTQKTKDWATRIPLKTNNDLQNTTKRTKDRATRTPLKTNNDLQNTTQRTKDRATLTPSKNKQWSTKHYKEN